ncbi:succinyl-diaminopimelate desuccinylase [Alteromonas mediterranea 615]|uniref:Succinyl-diaminopimelate desuccinylase n=1 Tax=Alteromonas mediterranea 615 TaxID=1300253 RepID=S5AH36_9ALTE|nr:succinyl-diaminopimelate desuccinylase [Alteromonas mediterranea 615]
MLKIIVLIPLILSLLWFGYLQTKNYTLEQGKQGFLYIFVLSGVIAAFYTLMLFLPISNKP